MLKVNRHKLKSIKCDKLKIVHISDLHYTSKFDLNLFKKIIQNTKELRPDYIFITGDIVDYASVLNDKEISKNLLIFLESLSYISKVFISLGNHDLDSSNDTSKWKELLKNEENIYLLDNEIYSDFKVNIVGVTLPHNYYYGKPIENPRIITNELSKYTLDNKYNILLIHSPRKVFSKDVTNTKLLGSFDLILSGHMHNGLIPKFLTKFPSSTGLVSPSRSLFPKYARGKVTKKINNHECTLIISGGVLQISPNMPSYVKLFKSMYNSEIGLIEIRDKNE